MPAEKLTKGNFVILFSGAILGLLGMYHEKGGTQNWKWGGHGRLRGESHVNWLILDINSTNFQVSFEYTLNNVEVIKIINHRSPELKMKKEEKPVTHLRFFAQCAWHILDIFHYIY